jgi:preprotein translocase subunit SecE
VVESQSLGLVIEEDKSSKKVDESFTAYRKPLIPCIQELRKVVFPEGKRWLKGIATVLPGEICT